MIILERALKSVPLFLEFKINQATLFADHGLQHCVIMWNRVTAQAECTAPGNPPLQLAYLRGYFFSELLGRGMPSDIAIRSAIAILGTGSQGGVDAASNAHLRPTVPTAFDLALSSGALGEAWPAAPGALDMRSLTSGSMPPPSSCGSSVPSSAGGLTREDVQAIVAAALVQAGVGGAPAGGTQPPGPPPPGRPRQIVHLAASARQPAVAGIARTPSTPSIFSVRNGTPRRLQRPRSGARSRTRPKRARGLAIAL